jgi:hypothetical protein
MVPVADILMAQKKGSERLRDGVALYPKSIIDSPLWDKKYHECLQDYYDNTSDYEETVGN